MKRTIATMVLISGLLAGCEPAIRNVPFGPEDVRTEVEASKNDALSGRQLLPIELTKSDPAALGNRYDFGAWMMAHNRLPQHAIILTLSGGGTRAATFAQAILRTLAQFDIQDPVLGKRTLADNVILISATSGGVMAAGPFVADRQDGVSALKSGYETNILQHSLADEGLGAALIPVFWHDRAYVMEHFMRRIVGDTRFADLSSVPDAITAAMQVDQQATSRRKLIPFLVLNSTDIIANRTWTFTQQRFADICSDLNPLPLATAMTAASAFPYILSDVELRNYRYLEREKVNCNDPSQEFGEPDRIIANQYNDLPSWTYARYRDDLRRTYWLGPDDDPVGPLRRYQIVHLFDGGLEDNLGLRAISRALNEKAVQALAVKGVEDLTVVEVNSRSDATDPRAGWRGSPPFILSLLESTSYNPIDIVTELSSAAVLAHFQAVYDQMSKSRGESLEAAATKVRPIVIDLDQLDTGDTADVPLVGKRRLIDVKEIGTMDTVDAEKMRLIQYTSRFLLTQNPCFQETYWELKLHYSAEADTELDALLGAEPRHPLVKNSCEGIMKHALTNAVPLRDEIPSLKGFDPKFLVPPPH